MFYKSKRHLILTSFCISFFTSHLFIKEAYCMDYDERSQNNNPLHIAAKKRDDAQLQQFLAQRFWVNKLAAMNQRGYTPLHLAVLENSISTTRILIRAGADINQTVTRSSSKTSLDLCLKQDPVNLDMLILLLQSGSVVGERLNDIIKSGNAHIVSLILNYGKNINVNGDRNVNKLFSRFESPPSPPLHYAVGNKEILELLLRKGANPNQADINGKTLCHLVVERSTKDQKDILNLLLHYNADPSIADNDLSTPLHLVSSQGDIRIFETLLERSKNINQRNKEGKTPLHLAVSSQSFEKTDALLKHGADVTAVDNKLSTPLHLASQADSAPIVNLLLSAGADANKQNQDGRLPLHLAANSFKAKNIESLFPYTHDVNKTDAKGSTSLHLLLGGSSSWDRREEEYLIQLIKLFLLNGADLTIPNEEGNTLLHLALKRDYFDVASFFLDCGIEVNTENTKKETPLFLAVNYGINYSLIERLLELGANPNHESAPLGVAWKNRNGLIVKLLLTKNAFPNVKFSKEKSFHRRYMTPLEEAAEEHNIEAVICLLRHGAKVPEGLLCNLINNLDWESRNHYFDTRRWGSRNHYNDDLRIITLLLKHGANPNAPNERGEYPLKKKFLSNLKSYKPIIQMLCQAGACQYLFEDDKRQILSLQTYAVNSLLQMSKSSPESLKKFYELIEISPYIKKDYFDEFLPLDTEEKGLEDKLCSWLNDIDNRERRAREVERQAEIVTARQLEFESMERERERRYREEEEIRWLRNNCE